MVGFDFLKEKPDINIYKNLFKFSGWLGVNKVVSAVAGRLDVQMLAYLVGATATGLYSIPARLSSFVIVLAGSLSSVIATRFASFSSKEKEKLYLKKTTLALLPIVFGVIFWIIIAKPFILILFGEKYLPAVGVFQALTAAMIPFIISVPAVNAIIYAIKKPIYIGSYAIFQLILIFVLNLLFIPKFATYGPTITLGMAYTIFAIYVWIIVIKHYWIDES
jgi:O-antigen/teichoic acid export membrane protein